jgi:hypothetical protein
MFSLKTSFLKLPASASLLFLLLTEHIQRFSGFFILLRSSFFFTGSSSALPGLAGTLLCQTL